MTEAERNLISSPATGLMIYNTTSNQPNYFNGTYWIDNNGYISAKIGDSLRGGIVFYINQPGDYNYSSSNQSGLIAATSDQSSGIAWITGGSTQTTENGNTNPALGYGEDNTYAMMDQTGYTGGAAQVCYSYEATDADGEVWDQWILPSKDELNKLYINRAVVGGFDTNKSYWSSSESSSINAFVQVFTGGSQTSNNKNTSNAVRAIYYY